MGGLSSKKFKLHKDKKVPGDQKRSSVSNPELILPNCHFIRFSLFNSHSFYRSPLSDGQNFVKKNNWYW